MKLSPYSKFKLKETLEYWNVDRDYADPMFNYLVYGYNPGSFFTCVLANDFMNAMAASHPANTVQALKTLVGWISDKMPKIAYGSYLRVEAWTDLDHEQRRAILENHNLIYTAKEETWMAVSGVPVNDTKYDHDLPF